MFIDRINLNHLRIFECVYRTRSMTTAAKELHLTQSGVSQHIKSLEDVLEVTLFDRIKQRLVPTRVASDLFRRATDSLYALEEAISHIKGGEKSLVGTLSVGMPIEFGNNIIMPELCEFGRAHSRLSFSMQYGFATEMNLGLLEGRLDFAFVDEFGMDPSIETKPVYDETLLLCASKAFVKMHGTVKKTREYFEALQYADYQPGEPVLRRWLEHHLGARVPKVSARVTVMDVQAIARLVTQGFVAGVLPDHVVERLQKQGHAIHAYEVNPRPLINRVSVAYLKGRTQSPAASAALDWLKARTSQGS